MTPITGILFAVLALAPLVAAGSPPSSKLDRAATAVQPLVEEAAGNGIRISVGLADVSGGHGGTRIVGSPDSYNPASTIKLALLATVMRQADRGMLNLDAPISISPYMVVGGSGDLQREEMPFTTTVGDVARRMVVLSDNTATNVLLYYVGLPTVQALLDDLDLGTMKFHRQMFPGDKIPPPANVTDAADTVALLQAVYTGDLLTEASRTQVLDWMRAQEVNTKFGAVLDGDHIAHKTGETGKVTHDVGYFLVPGSETIVAVFTEVDESTGYEDTMRIGNPVVQEIAKAIHAELER
ncbi:serine hydrolase [Luteimonas sp. MJ293]|uniref:serine hydrolase n=1 Tax=Luteimonas sp. MJ146 TaxID=3129240 RepID=UPI0031BACFC1